MGNRCDAVTSQPFTDNVQLPLKPLQLLYQLAQQRIPLQLAPNRVKRMTDPFELIRDGSDAAATFDDGSTRREFPSNVMASLRGGLGRGGSPASGTAHPVFNSYRCRPRPVAKIADVAATIRRQTSTRGWRGGVCGATTTRQGLRQLHGCVNHDRSRRL